MRDRANILRVLTAHFFRRFFDSDTVRVEGETLTTVVRAISVVAAPGLITAFFLENHYPGRTGWGAIEDQYFFVLYSFAVMGAVAIFQWEMLFPDRLDFLVLSPLPIRAWQLLTAKVIALLSFLSLFLISCNVFGAVVLPAVTSNHFYRQIYAHVVAVTLSGIFAAAFFLAFSGVLLCILNATLFRLISPFVQMFSIAILLLSFLYYGKVGDALPLVLAAPTGWARWVPPLWFLGVYEDLLHGASGPPLAHQMAMYGFRATGLAIAAAICTYPTAWVRMRRLAVEGVPSGLGQPSRLLPSLIRLAARQPAARAVLTFICQTLTRTSRYQIYLAMYGGVGLALAIFCAMDFSTTGSGFALLISQGGLYMALPLLLFWMVAGLRIAFALPMNLSAGWVFRVTGVSVRACANAARRWVLLCACALLLLMLLLLAAAGWEGERLLVQAVVGLCLCILLTDGFFAGQPSVPFNKARLPGNTNLPLFLILYLGFFPLFVYGVTRLEAYLERHVVGLVLVSSVVMLLHYLVRRNEDMPEEIEEEMEGYEGEFQVLGLSLPLENVAHSELL